MSLMRSQWRGRGKGGVEQTCQVGFWGHTCEETVLPRPRLYGRPQRGPKGVRVVASFLSLPLLLRVACTLYSGGKTNPLLFLPLGDYRGYSRG
jgi:hypothetical protein